MRQTIQRRVRRRKNEYVMRHDLGLVRKDRLASACSARPSHPITDHLPGGDHVVPHAAAHPPPLTPSWTIDDGDAPYSGMAG
jgi:hypothetical protein